MSAIWFVYPWKYIQCAGGPGGEGGGVIVPVWSHQRPRCGSRLPPPPLVLSLFICPTPTHVYGLVAPSATSIVLFAVVTKLQSSHERLYMRLLGHTGIHTCMHHLTGSWLVATRASCRTLPFSHRPSDFSSMRARSRAHGLAPCIPKLEASVAMPCHVMLYTEGVRPSIRTCTSCWL